MNSKDVENLNVITITDPIAFDCSASNMEKALEKLSSIHNIKVMRGYMGPKGLVDGPNPLDGGYTWTVTYDWDTLRGDKPLLVVVDTNFNAGN